MKTYITTVYYLIFFLLFTLFFTYIYYNNYTLQYKFYEIVAVVSQIPLGLDRLMVTDCGINITM